MAPATNTNLAAAPRGNRRGAEALARQRRVLKEAGRQFLAKGYAATSLNDIIARAGGSKATLQKYFGDKAGLFAAVITESARRFVSSTHLSELEGSPSQVLRIFGKAVLNFYLRRDALNVYRGVIAEGHRSPTMAKVFYNEGHAQIVAALSARLESWQQQDLVRCRESRADADRFLHILRAGIYEQTLIGLRRTHTNEELADHVGGCVDIFLAGLRP